jgi:hypothetical protein
MISPSALPPCPGIISHNLFVFLNLSFDKSPHCILMARQLNRSTRREARKNFRVEWHSPATIYYGRIVRACILNNLSNGGAKITGVKVATIPETFRVRITPHGRIHQCRVIWRTDEALGVQFTNCNTSALTQTSRKVANMQREATG